MGEFMTHLKSLFKEDDSLSAAERVAMGSLSISGVSSVIWVVTEKCNLRCIHCYEGNREPQRELSTEEAMRVIDRLYDAGKPLTFISGGEPLLRKDIYSILGRLKELGFRVILSTNGTLVDKAAERLASLEIDNIAIPLYGPQESHDSFTRMRGSHERVMRALGLLRDLGMGLTVKTVVARSVIPNLEYIFQMAQEFGARTIYLCDLIMVGRATLLTQELPSKDDWRRILDWIIEQMILGNEYPEIEVDIGLHPSTAIYVMESLRKKGYDVSEAEAKMRKRRLSVEGRGYLSISPTGDILISNYTPIKLGNALNDDLREVIRHPLYRAVGNSSKLRGWCGSCEYRDMCGGSRVKAYIYSGELLGEDPTCLLH
ncbi:MAG: hypothetical protein DRN78_01675 [Thermoproteota archaeon]|nr:MAG: hypothetical protein DRN78_01675 [Candidatus Korarchaeota archaeon]